MSTSFSTIISLLSVHLLITVPTCMFLVGSALQDTLVSIDQLIPPMQRMSQKEKAELIHQTIFPLDVSADRQYLISLRHGILVDRPKLEEILTEGRLSV